MFRIMSTVEVEALEKGLDKWWAGLGPVLKSNIRQLVSSARAKRNDLPSGRMGGRFDKIINGRIEEFSDKSLNMAGRKWNEAL